MKRTIPSVPHHAQPLAQPLAFCPPPLYPHIYMAPTALDQHVTPAHLAELTRLAEAAAHHAYAPYSRFFVGAAVLLESGEIVTGCNVENASYRLTTCAEQTAIASAVAQFGPAIRIRAVAIHNLNQSVCQPCGACCQTIAEFAPPTATILYPGPANTTVTCTLADLLPSAFHLA